MKGKRFFASLAILVALTSTGLPQTPADSCPNTFTFGAPSHSPADQSIAQVEITYFSTDDPSVFISERGGRGRSPTYTLLETSGFVARLQRLQREGVASIQKLQGVTSRLGERAEVRLERDSVNVDGGMINASLSAARPGREYEVERETQVSVSHNPRTDGDAYRVTTLSWFVDATRERGGFKTVDDDSSLLLKPGQTALIKLMSDFEVGRSGPVRKHLAVTLRSVSPAVQASARN